MQTHYDSVTRQAADRNLHQALTTAVCSTAVVCLTMRHVLNELGMYLMLPLEGGLVTIACMSPAAQEQTMEMAQPSAQGTRHTMTTVVAAAVGVDAAGVVSLPEESPMVMPGDSFTGKFKLIHPVAMEPGLRFAIREGGRTVGAGVVSKVVS